MQITKSFKDVKTELNMHVGNVLIFNKLSIIIGNSFNRQHCLFVLMLIVKSAVNYRQHRENSVKTGMY